MVLLSIPIVVVLFLTTAYLKNRAALTPGRAAILMSVAVFTVFYLNEISFGANPLKAAGSSFVVAIFGAGFGYLVGLRTQQK